MKVQVSPGQRKHLYLSMDFSVHLQNQLIEYINREGPDQTAQMCR